MEKAEITTDITASEFTPHAAKVTSNWGGIELMLSDDGETVYFRHNHGQDDLDSEPIYVAQITTGLNGDYFLDQNGEMQETGDFMLI